ncbi:FHA domain-containing protein [Acidihalobacter aeolianus]|uniref:FHA domain-containing protein n=1 Tax=Acidihalobacter aeolianus TaxID=2792603 RepID=UPI0018D3A12A|nr:FHA domain-containing protein [Acidihalobacter aeolianus]
MNNERRRQERRQWDTEVRYPFRDSDGREVVCNRRRVVDRRLALARRPSVLRLRYRGREVVLRQGQLRLGRHRSNDVAVDSPLASRYHAVILALEDGYLLVDTSRNGTFVRREGELGDTRVTAEETPLRGRGVIRLGSATDISAADLVFYEIGSV